MSGNALWNANWLEENTQRAYPLRFGPAAADSTNTVSIPEDFLVQMQLTITEDIDPTRFYIETIAVFGTGFLLTIRHTDDGFFMFQINIPNTAADFTTFRKLDESTQTLMHLTIGTLNTISTWPAGIWTFPSANTMLEFDVVRPSLVGVNRLFVKNGDTLSQPISGVVVLDAGPNILFKVSPSSAGQIVAISAGPNDGYVDDCTCGDTVRLTGIKTINGQTGDANGNFTLVGKGCYQFKPVTNGLEIVNTCTEPCCECDQLDGVLQDVRDFGTGAADLEQYIFKLQEAIDRLQFVTLLNQPNTAPCD